MNHFDLFLKYFGIDESVLNNESEKYSSDHVRSHREYDPIKIENNYFSEFIYHKHQDYNWEAFIFRVNPNWQKDVQQILAKILEDLGEKSEEFEKIRKGLVHGYEWHENLLQKIRVSKSGNHYFIDITRRFY